MSKGAMGQRGRVGSYHDGPGRRTAQVTDCRNGDRPSVMKRAEGAPRPASTPGPECTKPTAEPEPSLHSGEGDADRVPRTGPEICPIHKAATEPGRTGSREMSTKLAGKVDDRRVAGHTRRMDPVLTLAGFGVG